MLLLIFRDNRKCRHKAGGPHAVLSLPAKLVEKGLAAEFEQARTGERWDTK